jgi:hypothetical protein
LPPPWKAGGGLAAEQIRQLADENFPLAGKIILVMDNADLRFENIHSAASLYETFPAEEAKRLRDKLERYIIRRNTGAGLIWRR